MQPGKTMKHTHFKKLAVGLQAIKTVSFLRQNFARGILASIFCQKYPRNGIFACIAAIMILPGLLPWPHIRPLPQDNKPFGSRAFLPVNASLVTPASFASGGDTSFPLNFTATGNREDDCFAVADTFGGSKFIAPASRAIVAAFLPGYLGDGSKKERGPVSFDRGRVKIQTIYGPVPLAAVRPATLPPTLNADILQTEFFTAAAGRYNPFSLRHAEIAYKTGPHSKPDNVDSDPPVCTASRYNDIEVIRQLLDGLGGPHTGMGPDSKAERYQRFVEHYAEKYNLASALVFAIMQTESNFNPLAVSPGSAVGLMQIVPDTAGNDVYRFLMGDHGSPSVEALFSPEHNIRYGAAYLHLLGRRYFGQVKNPTSRQMCVIAAYNGGPGAVSRLFAPAWDEAQEKINSLTPSEVYATLTTEMPNQETRRYVELVLARIRDYSMLRTISY